MKKPPLVRLLVIILTIIVLSTPMSVAAWWTDTGVNPDSDTSAVIESGDCGDNVVYELRQSGNLYISGTGAMYDYTSSGAPWRGYAYDKPMYVYFDSGVTYIGKYAFVYCYALKHVNFPDTLTEIGDYAFYQAAELQSVVLPEGLTTIGSYAFCSCGHPGLDGYDFNAVTLPSTIKTIGDGAFSMCGRLRSINLPDGLESLGNNAFASCFYLTSIELPDSVTSVGGGVFNSCNRLVSLRLSDNLQVLPKNMFSAVDPNMTSMSEITLPLNLKSIESNALNGRDLQTIYIPGNVESIATGAFGDYFNGTIYFSGDAPNFDTETFRKNVTIYYPEGNNTWNGIVGQSFGSSITWVSYEVANCDNGHTYNNGVCTVCGASEYFRMVLTEDTKVALSLTQDLYLDLAGFDLTGTITTNGYKIYGMDSATDSYSCENMGSFACVDENGDLVEPERFYTDSSAKQYLSVFAEVSYSFHCFWLGVTHMSLDPEVTGVGYKAAVFGDELVLSQLDEKQAFSFCLQLEDYRPVYRHIRRDGLISGKSMTLRLRNYDVENYGEANLFVNISITLGDGTVIETTQAAMTLRSLVETVNANYSSYTDSQLADIKTMLEKYEVVKKWDISNLI